jgi:hypothetical protein
MRSWHDNSARIQKDDEFSFQSIPLEKNNDRPFDSSFSIGKNQYGSACEQGRQTGKKTGIKRGIDMRKD